MEVSCLRLVWTEYSTMAMSNQIASRSLYEMDGEEKTSNPNWHRSLQSSNLDTHQTGMAA